MRPLAKVAMRGVVTATEATSAGRRGLQELYREVKAERQQGSASTASAGAGQESQQESASTPAAG